MSSGYVNIIFSHRPQSGVSEWQTRQTQNLLWATTCGFKSRCRQLKMILTVEDTSIFDVSFFINFNHNKGTRQQPYCHLVPCQNCYILLIRRE